MHLPTLSPGRLAGAVALASAVALMPVAAFAAGSATAPARAAGTPRCATSGLVVWLDVPPGNHYAGGAAYDLEFTNLSGHACTLRGYPGVSAVSLGGRQIGSPAGWGSPATTTVRLASGATATAGLQITDPGAYANRCLLPRHGSSRGGRGRRPGCASTRPTSPRRN